MEHTTYEEQIRETFCRLQRKFLAEDGIVHHLCKTRQNGVTIFELVSSDADGQRFKFSTFYTYDTGEKRETHFSLSGRELIRYAAIAADLDDAQAGNV